MDEPVPFFLFILCFILFLFQNQYFFIDPHHCSSDVFRGVCWTIFIFQFNLGEPLMDPRNCIPRKQFQGDQLNAYVCVVT